VQSRGSGARIEWKDYDWRLTASQKGKSAEKENRKYIGGSADVAAAAPSSAKAAMGNPRRLRQHY
jgi:hypothetical protein